MGCVQAKQSVNSPPRGLQKLKLENGYVVGERGGGRPLDQKAFNKESNKLFWNEGPVMKKKLGAVGDGGNDAGEGKLFASKEEKKQGGGTVAASDGGGIVSRKVLSTRHNGGDVLVDGWPKWLTDNILKEALVGLVHKSAESYDQLDKIGQGTYSNVYKARERDTGKIVALKMVRFDISEPESVRFMAREITLLQKLDHPNVVKLEGLATCRMQYSLYLVFDFMVSDLSRIVCRPDKSLSEPQIKCYMQQLLSGLRHCHERGILHRDIKGSNLLIDIDGTLKIADFGLANHFDPDQKKPLTNHVVTLWYRAPELLFGATDYGVGIDLWSAGCLMAEMFAGRPIMPGRTDVEQLHKVFKLCGSPSEDYWKKLNLPTSFRPPQPYKSILVEVFRNFPTSSLSLLTKLLSLDPAHRGSASSALESEFFTTSPLACGLSGLPAIHMKEDDFSKLNYREKSRSSQMNLRSQTQREGPREKDFTYQKLKERSGSYKEEQGKSTDQISYYSHEGSSAGSTSTVNPRRKGKETSSPQAFSAAPFQWKKPRTEGHPNATKNINNQHPLPMKKTISNIEGKDSKYILPVQRRSVSTKDFRQLEAEMMAKNYPIRR